MATSRLLRPSNNCLRSLKQSPIPAHRHRYTTSASGTPQTSPFAPRHLLSIADLSPQELTTLVRNASAHKTAAKSSSLPAHFTSSLAGQSIALTFSKRSTRTRVSTEAAAAMMGAHPMFLGSQDIQLGVNESLYDTSVVISSMVSCIVARVNGHADVADLAKHSSVPVINALSDLYHPLQTIADFLTVHEAFPSTQTSPNSKSLGLEGMKIAWVGDANNVLYDLAIGAQKLGVEISVATPKGYEIPAFMRDIINNSAPDGKSTLTETNVPEEAVKNADIIVTDTWVSMGQEEEKAKRVRDFAGFQVTKELAIPTIGIGAGNQCDAQVLVWQDMLGLRTGRMPRFVKQYADLHTVMLGAAQEYAADVAAGTFPGRIEIVGEGVIDFPPSLQREAEAPGTTSSSTTRGSATPPSTHSKPPRWASATWSV